MSPDRWYKRSPFCLLLWDDDALCALNCDSFRMFRGAERYVALLHQLGEWTTAAQLAERGGNPDPAQCQAALERLVSMGLALSSATGPHDQPAAESATTDWSPIDLAMQRQSSTGGFDPSRARGPAPPAFKDPPASTPTELPQLSLHDRASLRGALERRRSVRTYGEGGLSLEQLGMFLWSTARVTRTVSDPVVGEFSQRPYPSGGARHPLEVYPVCNAVESVPPGAYWYEPRHHLLYPLGSSVGGQEALNGEVRAAAGDISSCDPPVVFVLTAVFQRTMWKYDRLGLTLVLKDVGCLYQTMHLVAAAAGMAGCPLGAGRESENARWLGLDPLVESQVGAFLLGPAPA